VKSVGTIYLGNWDDVLRQLQVLVDDGKVGADVIDKVKQLRADLSKGGGLRHLAKSANATDYVNARNKQERKHGYQT
jgi:hypothetical protein